MTHARPLLVAVPAFLLGCLLTATLTTTAQAQTKSRGSRPMYHTATTESDLNRYAADGYEVKETSHTSTYVQYLMQRFR